MQSNVYASSFIHRSVSFDGGPVSIVQGGGYAFRLPFSVIEVPRDAPVPLEYNLANDRGTLAAARTNDINSATSEWFFNVRDNSSTLGPANNSGYTVLAACSAPG